MQRHQQPLTMEIGQVCALLLQHYYDAHTKQDERDVLYQFWKTTMSSGGTYRQAYRAAVKQIEVDYEKKD